MHLLRALPYTLIILLLSSCSITKSLYKDKHVSQYNPVADSVNNSHPISKVEEAPDKEDELPQEELQEGAELAPEAEHELPYPYPLPEMNFGETESAHVRIPISLNNPFPPSGELEIPLTELKSDFCYPYPGKLNSPFGHRGRSIHSGVDIQAVLNDTIRAAFSGVVRMSKLYSSYGNVIVIRHYNGIETAYAHNSRNLVGVNDVVRAGDPIALAGRTGRATGVHLHFEFRVAGQALNPNLLIDTENQQLRTDTLYLYNRDGNIKVATHPLSDSDLPAVGEASDGDATAPSAVPNDSKSKSKELYHTIKKGDTLSKLARTYSTTVSKLCQLNNIEPTTILRIKQRIRVR